MINPVLIALHRKGIVEWEHPLEGLISIPKMYDKIALYKKPQEVLTIYAYLFDPELTRFDQAVLCELVARLKAIMMTYGDSFRNSDDFKEFQRVRHDFEKAVDYAAFIRIREAINGVLGKDGD